MHLKLKKGNLNSFKAELPETKLSRGLIGFGERAVFRPLSGAPGVGQEF